MRWCITTATRNRLFYVALLCGMLVLYFQMTSVRNMMPVSINFSSIKRTLIPPGLRGTGAGKLKDAEDKSSDDIGVTVAGVGEVVGTTATLLARVEPTKTSEKKSLSSKIDKESLKLEIATTTTTTTTKMPRPTTTETTKAKTTTDSKTKTDLEQLIKTQQCNIPRLDPFHKSVRSYIVRTKPSTCETKRFARVSGGILHLKLDNVQRAGLYYIRRHVDVGAQLSDYHNLLPQEIKGDPGCIHTNKGDGRISFRTDPTTGERHAYLLKESGGGCPDEDVVIFSSKKIVHKASQFCFALQTCLDVRSDCKERAERGECTTNSTEMAENCRSTCNLCTRVAQQKTSGGSVSCGHHDAADCASCTQGNGGSWCNGDCAWCNIRCQPKSLPCDQKEKFFIKLSSDPAECSDIFTIDEQRRIKHTESKTRACIGAPPSENGYLMLGKCNENDFNIFFIPVNMLPKTKVDMKYELKEEMVALKLVRNLRTHIEYHLTALKTPTPIRDPEPKTDQPKQASPDNSKTNQSDAMNFILINFDSQSRANVQRQWNETYRYLSQDPNSVILKGLVINGDATTENLAPFLTGYAVKDLPEARKWKPNWGYLNRWPFIFKVCCS